MLGYFSADYGDIADASILGFCALASALVLADDQAPEQAKRYPRQIPVSRLGRLAIRSGLQGLGLGPLLLADALARSCNAALSVGSAGIFVDAKNSDAFCDALITGIASDMHVQEERQADEWRAASPSAQTIVEFICSS